MTKQFFRALCCFLAVMLFGCSFPFTSCQMETNEENKVQTAPPINNATADSDLEDESFLPDDEFLEEEKVNIKIGTFNIQHGVDRLHLLATNETKLNLTAISDAIKEMNLDICGLNEVWNHKPIEGVEGECNQAEFIAEKLGYHYFFAKAIPHGFDGGEYGNALVSKYPILSAKCIPLHIPEEQRGEGYYEDRVILQAEIDVYGKVITVLSSHFGLVQDEMTLAVDTVRELVKECKMPVILMGDFNFEPNSPHYPRLSEILTDTAALMNKAEATHPSEAPVKRIDYIFINDQVTCLDFNVPDLIISDHKPCTAVIEV